MWWWLAVSLAQQTDEAPGAEDTPSDQADTPSDSAETEADEAPPDEEEAPAEPVDAPAPAVLVIPAYGLTGGLSTLETAGAEHSASEDAKAGAEALARLEGIDWSAPTSMLRGRWYARPVLSFDELGAGAARARALRAGAALGRMWFTTGGLPVQGGADVGLHASAPLGQATGYRLHAHALAGPWLGPVGVRVGPTFRADRTRFTNGGTELALLDDAALVGGRVVLAFDVGSLAPYVDFEPAWAVAGTRARPTDPVLLPALGTETRYGGGLTLQGSFLALTGHVHWSETGVGRVLELGAGLTIRPRSTPNPGDDQ